MDKLALVQDFSLICEIEFFIKVFEYINKEKKQADIEKLYGYILIYNIFYKFLAQQNRQVGFDEFQKSLAIAPNMLTRRLRALVEGGLLEKKLYSEHPPRYQYVLTPRGRDLSPVLITLLTWGNKHFAPEGPSILIADTQSGEIADPILVDRLTGQEISAHSHVLVAGPAASEGMIQRLQDYQRQRDSDETTTADDQIGRASCRERVSSPV